MTMFGCCACGGCCTPSILKGFDDHHEGDKLKLKRSDSAQFGKWQSTDGWSWYDEDNPSYIPPGKEIFIDLEMCCTDFIFEIEFTPPFESNNFTGTRIQCGSMLYTCDHKGRFRIQSRHEFDTDAHGDKDNPYSSFDNSPTFFDNPITPSQSNKRTLQFCSVNNFGGTTEEVALHEFSFYRNGYIGYDQLSDNPHLGTMPYGYCRSHGKFKPEWETSRTIRLTIQTSNTDGFYLNGVKFVKGTGYEPYRDPFSLFNQNVCVYTQGIARGYHAMNVENPSCSLSHFGNFGGNQLTSYRKGHGRAAIINDTPMTVISDYGQQDSTWSVTSSVDALDCPENGPNSFTASGGYSWDMGEYNGTYSYTLRNIMHGWTVPTSVSDLDAIADLADALMNDDWPWDNSYTPMKHWQFRWTEHYICPQKADETGCYTANPTCGTTDNNICNYGSGGTYSGPSNVKWCGSSGPCYAADYSGVPKDENCTESEWVEAMFGGFSYGNPINAGSAKYILNSLGSLFCEQPCLDDDGEMQPMAAAKIHALQRYTYTDAACTDRRDEFNTSDPYVQSGVKDIFNLYNTLPVLRFVEEPSPFGGGTNNHPEFDHFDLDNDKGADPSYTVNDYELDVYYQKAESDSISNVQASFGCDTFVSASIGGSWVGKTQLVIDTMYVYYPDYSGPSVRTTDHSLHDNYVTNFVVVNKEWQVTGQDGNGDDIYELVTVSTETATESAMMTGHNAVNSTRQSNFSYDDVNVYINEFEVGCTDDLTKPTLIDITTDQGTRWRLDMQQGIYVRLDDERMLNVGTSINFPTDGDIKASEGGSKGGCNSRVLTVQTGDDGYDENESIEEIEIQITYNRNKRYPSEANTM